LIHVGSTQELVALSGAHTLGGKGFGSPVVFDNAYFKILLEKPWTSPGEWTSHLSFFLFCSSFHFPERCIGFIGSRT